jgi:hypothetical protein
MKTETKSSSVVEANINVRRGWEFKSYNFINILGIEEIFVLAAPIFIIHSNIVCAR